MVLELVVTSPDLCVHRRLPGLGRYDYLVPPAYLWEGIRNKFSSLTIRVFEKSSHAPQFEEPKLFDKELLEWLFKS